MKFGNLGSRPGQLDGRPPGQQTVKDIDERDDIEDLDDLEDLEDFDDADGFGDRRWVFMVNGGINCSVVIGATKVELDDPSGLCLDIAECDCGKSSLIEVRSPSRPPTITLHRTTSAD